MISARLFASSFASFAVLVLLAGCSGSSAPAISVAISPGAATLIGGATQTFAATVTNDSANAGVTWTASTGTITTAGLYTAPAVITGTSATVTATSKTDATKSATVTVTLTPISVNTISPASISLDGGGSHSFTVTVASDGSSSGVTWSIGAGVGTLSNVTTTGVTYTAPAVISGTSPVTVSLVATSIKDPTKSSAAAVITLNPITVAISTTPVAMIGGATQSFSATVGNDGSNSGVTWSVTSGGGSFTTTTTASGASTTYTAASPVTTATAVLKATSIKDTTKTASVTVTLTPITIAFSTATTGILLDSGQTLALAATVANDSSASGATFTVSGAGTVSPSSATGNSPATALTATGTTASSVTVTATSIKDTTKSASTAAITVNPALAITNSGALTGATTNTVYPGATITATGGSGTKTFTIATGSLPAGLTLSAAGAISGTATGVAGISTFTVKVTDSATTPFSVYSFAYTITVSAAPLVWVTPTTETLTYTVGTTITPITLSTSGGTGAVSYSLNSGSLPAGLSIVGNHLSGTPTAPTVVAGNVVTFLATDSASTPVKVASASVTLIVNPVTLVITSSTLPTGTVAVHYSDQLASTGGTGTIAWTMVPTTVDGITLSAGGLLSGTPTTTNASNVTITATDSATNQQQTKQVTLALNVTNALTVTTTSLPTAFVGTAYTPTLAAAGGSGTGYTWSITAGASNLSALGPITLGSNGSFSGTPTTSGSATISVQVKDSANNTANANFTITVNAALSVTTTTLPSGTAGVSYNQTLVASGGSGSGYTWTITSGASSLSAVGLTLTSGGVISGSPTSSGAVSFTAKVTDSASNSATKSYSFTVYSALSVTTTSVANGTFGALYTQTLAAAGGSGTGYTWTVTSGAGLSAVGLSLSGGGVISGTPNAVENAGSFTVKVTDSIGNTATATLALNVVYGTLSIATTNIPGATVSASYSEQFAASGGSGNYSWAVTTNLGGLTGETLTFTTGGLLSGTPTTVENVPFTVTVTDTTTSNTAHASYTLAVSAATAALCSHDGSGNSLLNGNYAFLLGGFDPNGNNYDQIGDFVADGAGNITGGNGDANSSGFATQGEQQYTFSGTYSIGSTDDRGIMTVTNANTAATGLPTTADYCFAADTVTTVSGKTVAESGRIIQADGSGFVVSGFFQIQNTADFVDSALSTGYAFGAQGVNESTDGGIPVTARAAVIGAGLFNGTGGITSGQVDTAQYDPSTDSTTYTAAQSSSPAGTYSITSSGRGTLTLGTGVTATPFVVYVVGNGNMLLMLSADNVNTGTLLVGQANAQTSTSFTTANVAGTSVFRGSGVDNASVTSTPEYVDDVAVGQVSLNGSGGISTVIDENDGGTINATSTGTGTYTVSSLGYMTVSGVGKHSPNFYLYAPGAGFGMTGDSSVQVLYLQPQTIPSGGFTSASISGDYAIGTIPPAAYSVNGTGTTDGDSFPYVFDAAVVAGTSTLTLTQDANEAPGLPADIAVDQTNSTTWALDPTYGSNAGRFTANTGNAIGYIVSSTEAFIIDYQAGKDPSAYELDHK